MITPFHLNAKELNDDFVQAIKHLFKNQALKVTVESEMDETDFLNAVKANSDMVKKSISEFEMGDLVTVNLEDLK